MKEKNELQGGVQKKDAIAKEANQEHKLLGFITRNSKVIIVLGVAVIAVVLLIYYFNWRAEKRYNEASLALMRVIEYYQIGEYETALNGNPQIQIRGEKLKGLKEISDEYSSTEPGKTAAFFAGLSATKLGEVKEAKDFYVEASKSKSEAVSMGGFAGMASCFETEGNYKEAAENYIKAADKALDDNSKARYMYFAGLSFEKAGDKQKAGEFYKRIVDELEKSSFINYAKSGLVRLGIEFE
ncbi:MAG: tetratricopeptide repeat protein [bacterium]